MANMSIPALPPELLHIVFSNLNDHADFYSLCLVSKCFYASAIRFLYRRLKIPHRASGEIVAPLHAVLSSQQQEKFLRRPLEGQGEEEEGRLNGSKKGLGFDKELSDCGEFVKEFEVAHRVGEIEDADIGEEIIESAVENMSCLESFVWNTQDPNLPRTRRISTSLTRKPLLHSLSLSNILDTDIPLLNLHPLHSVTFKLESNFASFAHRPSTSTADYDITYKILKTSSTTLKSLSLVTERGPQPHYEDEGLIFGGEAAAHTQEPPEERIEVTRLVRLESLTLVERLFTAKRLGVLTQAIDFNNLRRLEILSCTGVELLLSAITTREAEEPEKGREIFPHLRTLSITTSQSALTNFLKTFKGLQDLRYELECETTDWTAPGGYRRQVSSSQISKDLLDTITSHHGATLLSLSIPAFEQWKVLDRAGMRTLAEKCLALENLCCCVEGFNHNAKQASTYNCIPTTLSTLYLHQRSLVTESNAREIVRKLLVQRPKLKTVAMLAGRYRARPFVFKISEYGVLEKVSVKDSPARGKLRDGEFED